VSLGLVALATLLFLVPAVPSWHGDHERHSIEILSIPVSVVLLLTYCGVTAFALRRHRRLHVADEPAEMIAWPLTTSLVVLALATGLTAAIAEILVHSLETFAERAGLTDFFVAAVIVAIVGNAAEHGGAVIVAYRGRIRLAAEIALASSAQVAVFLVPAVALLAWPIEPLGLGFRPVEVISLGIAVVVVAALLADGRSSRTRGAVLVAAYAGIAVAYYLVGDR
jgi:Ca2+:H+ antiporter